MNKIHAYTFTAHEINLIMKALSSYILDFEYEHINEHGEIDNSVSRSDKKEYFEMKEILLNL